LSNNDKTPTIAKCVRKFEQTFDYDSLPHRLAKIESQMVKQSATPIEPERVYKCMVVIGGFVDAPLGKQTALFGTS